MTVSLKHKFVSSVPDDADTSLVRPSNWNDDHDLLLATNRLLGRTTAGAGAAEEISVSGELTLSAGALSTSANVVTTSGTQTLTNKTLTSPVITGGTTVTVPTATYDITNKEYVDSVAQGLNFHQACKYATAAALSAYTYNNGTSGVGATLTANAVGALSIDGNTPSVGDRILVKNETSTNAPYNGVYTVTTVGNGSTAWVMTRATDFDEAGSGPNQIDAGDFLLILSGTANANTSWVQQTPLPITVGTTDIVFIQFGATTFYTAGTGLTLVGNQFSLTNPVATNLGGTGLTGFTAANNAIYSTSASGLTAGTLPIAAGGTGQTSASAAFNALSPVTSTGDLIIGNGANSSTRLGIGTNGYVLTSNGTTATWSAPPAAGVTSFQTSLSGLNPSTSTTGAVTLSGTLGATSGGTDQTTYTTGDVLYASGTSALAKLGIGSTGQVLTVSGGIPSWTTPTTGGATGGGTDKVFWNNDQTVTTSYSIPTNNNAGTFGPVTISGSATVTIPADSTWTIV